jgi:ribosome-associated translation inhibitor RaiA
MRRASNTAAGVQTVKTTYRDFESREYLTEFVNDMVQHALAKFLDRHNTRIDVTLDNSEKRTRRRLFSVGITLHPAHQAPIHVTREADKLQDAIRAAVSTIKKILRRDHAKLVGRRRHLDARVA